jgi:hypothetical protein
VSWEYVCQRLKDPSRLFLESVFMLSSAALIKVGPSHGGPSKSPISSLSAAGLGE